MPEIQISTTRPPFRVGYRRRSTTTPDPIFAGSSTNTSRSRPISSAAAAAANITMTTTTTTTSRPRTTKHSRRKAAPSRTTNRPVESQVSSTLAPAGVITSRFRFVSRKPYLRTTTQKLTSQSDQNIESTNQQNLENTETTKLADIASALQNIQLAPSPQAKPSKKRPQILRLSSQYTTPKPNITTPKYIQETYTTPYSNRAQKFSNKKTVAVTIPFLRGTYVTPSSVTADGFFGGSVVTGPPYIKQVYSSPQSITASDYINKYTPSLGSPIRSRVRYSTTSPPFVVITPGKSTVSKRRKQPQAYDKVFTPEDINTYRPAGDYDYYDNIETSILGKIPEHSKVLLHSNGIIECLDQGNFPHPVSCKKFISCAKMEGDKILAWEYTCPKNLSFDPIGGMCNWSAGLGCNEA